MDRGEHRIDISSERLMEQATWTAQHYLLKALDMRVDSQQLAAFMQTCAIDMAGAIIAQQIRAGLDNIAAAIRERNELEG